MSYRNSPGALPSRRFATIYCGRIAAANYHGARIARLLAAKMGMQPIDVLSLMARPLAREAARELGLSVRMGLADLVEASKAEGGHDHGH
jgi:hypothetical protein